MQVQMSLARTIAVPSSILSVVKITRISRPAWSAKKLSTPSKLLDISSSCSRRLHSPCFVKLNALEVFGVVAFSFSIYYLKNSDFFIADVLTKLLGKNIMETQPNRLG